MGDEGRHGRGGPQERACQVIFWHCAEETVLAIALSGEIKNLVDRPNFAHLATLMPDGSPHSAPVWIAREGDLLMICTEASSLKGKNTQRDPRVAISIVDFGDPYSEVQMRGRVIERRPDPQLKYFDLMSQKYIGRP